MAVLPDGCAAAEVLLFDHGLVIKGLFRDRRGVELCNAFDSEKSLNGTRMIEQGVTFRPKDAPDFELLFLLAELKSSTSSNKSSKYFVDANKEDLLNQRGSISKVIGFTAEKGLFSVVPVDLLPRFVLGGSVTEGRFHAGTIPTTSLNKLANCKETKSILVCK
jgi:hypothetical protein